MTVFEKEMRKIFGEFELLSADTLFTNKVMLSPIGENLRAKVEFVSMNEADHYNTLRLSIINRTEGVVDTQAFKFKDIIGIKNGYEPHLWDDCGNVGYAYTPSPYYGFCLLLAARCYYIPFRICLLLHTDKTSSGKHYHFHLIYLPYLRPKIRAVLDFVLFGKLVRFGYALYTVFVRQTEALP